MQIFHFLRFFTSAHFLDSVDSSLASRVCSYWETVVYGVFMTTFIAMVCEAEQVGETHLV
jgi:hypothetical protein